MSRTLAIHGGDPVRTSPVGRNWPDFGEEEAEQLREVLQRSQLGLGHPIGKIPEFEEAFAAAHGVEAAVACTNCSQALEVLLAVTGVEPGDEVIVPAYTYVATAGAVVAVGAIPVFADIEPLTYQIDPESVAANITERTRAIIVVHFAGHFADMFRFRELADRHGLILIEDAAHAPGARWNGHFPGGLGDAAAFSFQYSKNMTSQEGGAIISRDSDLVERCREYVCYGRRPGHPWYSHYQISSNYRLTEFQAAILLAQLGRLERRNRQRAENARALDKLLEAVPGVTPATVDPGTEVHAQHLYIVRFDAEIVDAWGGKQSLVQAIDAEGVRMLSGYVYPVYATPGFRDKQFRTSGWFSTIYEETDYSEIRLRETEAACEQCTWLLHNSLLGPSEEMADIAEAIRKVTSARP